MVLPGHYGAPFIKKAAGICPGDSEHACADLCLELQYLPRVAFTIWDAPGPSHIHS